MTSRTLDAELLHRMGTEICPDVTQDEAGLEQLFTQFSVPGGISGHGTPTTARQAEARAGACSLNRSAGSP